MQKKYQVFVSSTYTDLIEERKKVQEILLMADCIPAGMEAFVATSDEQFEVIKKVIDLCDYYVLIIGGRYGSISPNTGLSYTEMEYDYAVSKNIPILVFAIDESVLNKVGSRDVDNSSSEKLTAFRHKAMASRLSSIWKDKGDLAGQLAISIMKAKNELTQPGWIRGDEFDPIALETEIKRLNEECVALQKKNQKLQEEIDNLKSISDELEFDSAKLKVGYSNLSSSPTSYKEITVKEIFKYVSIHMVRVSISDSKMEDLIAQSVGAFNKTCLKDKNFTAVICNQLLALKLIDSKWVEGKGLFYFLTPKGHKINNELNLIRKK